MTRYRKVYYGTILKSIKIAVRKWGPRPLKDILKEVESVVGMPIDHNYIKAKLGNQVITKTTLEDDIAVVRDWVYPEVTASPIEVRMKV